MISLERQLKRIRWDIVCRLAVIIHYYPKSKRTRIAMKSGLAYDKCMLYLDWMEMMDLIERHLEEGFQVISLSEKGNELYMTQCQNTVQDLEETVYVT